MKPSVKNLIQTSLVTAIIAGSAFAVAEDGDRRSEREPCGPPPEAFEACASAAQGDACEVQTRRGDVRTGECRLPRRHKPFRAAEPAANGDAEAQADGSFALLCVPEHRRRSRGEETELR